MLLTLDTYVTLAACARGLLDDEVQELIAFTLLHLHLFLLRESALQTPLAIGTSTLWCAFKASME